MKQGLVARGVPADAITCDLRGWRTLDSVIRARENFGLQRCAIISDGWHVPRALFIARKCGLDAIGISATPVPLGDSLKARTREWGARVLVVLDLYLLDTRPKNSEHAGEVDLSTIGREPRRPPASARR
jgi:SanA protein